MRFACLGYVDEENGKAMSNDERDAMIEECFAYDVELLKSGSWRDGGQALQGTGTAKTLRLKNGKLVVTDGPFAETKEQLGGIGIVEARDMDHAVEIMSKHPGVRFGPFEIRPVDESLNERCRSKPAASDPFVQGTKLVCLGCGDESAWNRLSTEEQAGLLEECMSYDQVLRKYGRMVGGEALQSARTAKTLRLTAGKLMVTDGPYAETKEQVGGVAVVEFRNMDQAIEVWSKHPCLRMGDALEIRPVNEEFNARWQARQKRVEAMAGR